MWILHIRFNCIKMVMNSRIFKFVTTEVEVRVLLSVKHYFISHHIKLKPFESTFVCLFLLKIVLYKCRYMKLLQHYLLCGFNVYGCQIRMIKCKFLSGVHAVRNDFQDIYSTLKHILDNFWWVFSSLPHGRDWLTPATSDLWWLTSAKQLKPDLWL